MSFKTSIKQKIARVHSWIRQHRTVSIGITGLLVVLIALGTTYALYPRDPVLAGGTMKVPMLPRPEPKKFYSPLTGREVKDEAATKQAATAIMIENSPDARPQSGLKDAGIVFEAIAEGGITRFLALYQEAKPQLIGPVRSLRMYYVDWLAPYNASVAHIGGSAASLAEIRNGAYRDIDEFLNGQYYWRSTDRWAPHNVYTSFEKLDALNASKGYTESRFTGFKRTDSKPSNKPNATSLAINFSSPLFNTTYQYDKALGAYKRSVGGEAHEDREAGQITPNTVIAMYVDETLVFEDGYRQSIVTTGSGKALIFQNGIVKEATWNKKDRQAPLTFTADPDNKEVELVRGQTWIAAVPNQEGEVTWQ